MVNPQYYSELKMKQTIEDTFAPDPAPRAQEAAKMVHLVLLELYQLQQKQGTIDQEETFPKIEKMNQKKQKNPSQQEEPTTSLCVNDTPVLM